MPPKERRETVPGMRGRRPVPVGELPRGKGGRNIILRRRRTVEVLVPQNVLLQRGRMDRVRRSIKRRVLRARHRSSRSSRSLIHHIPPVVDRTPITPRPPLLPLQLRHRRSSRPCSTPLLQFSIPTTVPAATILPSSHSNLPKVCAPTIVLSYTLSPPRTSHSPHSHSLSHLHIASHLSPLSYSFSHPLTPLTAFISPHHTLSPHLHPLSHPC